MYTHYSINQEQLYCPQGAITCVAAQQHMTQRKLSSPLSKVKAPIIGALDETIMF